MHMSITITLEATRLKCTECDHLFTEEEPGDVRANAEPAYECGNCGQTFTKDDSPSGNHQCPGCNKFASKMDPEWFACPECLAATEGEEVPVITCVCHDEEHEVNC
jgi:rubredoxin